MTGTHMGHAYVRGNAGASLREEDQTLPKALKQAGYATGMFGKWGLAESEESGLPHRQGFDAFLGYLRHVHAHSYYTDHLFAIQDGGTERIDVDTTQYTHDLFVEGALDFIEANQDKPFFLYLPLALVHAELLVPEEDIAPFRDENGRSRLLPDPPFPCCGIIGTYRGQPTPHAAHAAMVTPPRPGHRAHSGPDQRTGPGRGYHRTLHQRQRPARRRRGRPRVLRIQRPAAGH